MEVSKQPDQGEDDTEQEHPAKDKQEVAAVSQTESSYLIQGNGRQDVALTSQYQSNGYAVSVHAKSRSKLQENKIEQAGAELGQAQP